MQFDKTITLGHLLIIVTLISGGIGIYTSMQITLSEHSYRINRLEKEVEHRNKVSRDLSKWVRDIRSDIAVIKTSMENNKK